MNNHKEREAQTKDDLFTINEIIKDVNESQPILEEVYSDQLFIDHLFFDHLFGFQSKINST